MDRGTAIERKLKRDLIPVAPRKEFFTALRAKLMYGTKMPVEMERANKTNEVVTLATLGLGAVAAIAAVATIGVKVVTLVGSENMAKSRKGVKQPSVI